MGRSALMDEEALGAVAASAVLVEVEAALGEGVGVHGWGAPQLVIAVREAAVVSPWAVA